MLPPMDRNPDLYAAVQAMRRYLAALLGGTPAADGILRELLRRAPHRLHGLSSLEALRLAHSEARGDQGSGCTSNPLRRALMDVPFERRGAFVLIQLEGLQPREAGWVLGMPSAIVSRLAEGTWEQLRHSLFPESLLAVVVDHDALNARRVCNSLQAIAVEARSVSGLRELGREGTRRPLILITEAIDGEGRSRGPETAFSARDGGQPVLCMTDASRFEQFRAHVPGARLLAKPFGPVDLRECVMEMIASGGPGNQHRPH